MSKDASAIYMLGDMFDFWFEYFIHDASKRRFSPLFKFLRKFKKQGLHRDFYIFGHTHTAADIPITDKTRVIFLGDCFAQWTYAQLDEDGQLSLCRFEN